MRSIVMIALQQPGQADHRPQRVFRRLGEHRFLAIIYILTCRFQSVHSGADFSLPPGPPPPQGFATLLGRGWQLAV